MSVNSTRESSDQLPVDAPSANEQSDFVKIKSIMELYRIVFKTFAECQPHVLVRHIQFDDDPVLRPPIYTMTVDSDDFANADLLTTGLLALPDGTPQDLREAYMNMLLCDTAVVMLLEPVSRKLQEMGAHVQWFVLEPLPRFLLQYTFHDTEMTRNTLHSVMGITLSNGEQYVADFTSAQFGYDPEHWFMRSQEYMDRYVDGEMVWCSDDDGVPTRMAMEAKWLMPCNYEGQLWIPRVREVASNIDWAALEHLTQMQRLETVQAEAKTAFDAFRSGGAWRVDAKQS